MKLKTLLLSIFIICTLAINSSAKAQKNNLNTKRDNLKFRLKEPDAMISINMVRITDMNKLIKSDNKIFDFEKHISLAINYLDNDEIETSSPRLSTKIRIKYDKDNNMSSSLKQSFIKNKEYTINKQAQLKRITKDTLIVVTADYISYSICLYNINDLRLIKEQNLKNEIKKQLKKITQRGLKYKRTITKDTGIFESIEVDEKTGSECFNINIIPSMMLYKNKFIPSITGELEYLKNIGVKTIYIAVSYENMIDYRMVNGKSKRTINGFIDLSFRLKSNYTKYSKYAPGFNIGYLIKRRGDIFEKNTFRIGFPQNIGKAIQLVPELYFPGKLNRITPGLKLKYSF